MAGFNNDYMGMNGQSVALAAAQTHDLALVSTILLVTPQNTLDEITGAIPPVYDAGIIFIVNIHATRSLVLPYNDSGSTAGYRWLNVDAADLTVLAGETAMFAFVPGLGWQFLKFAALP